MNGTRPKASTSMSRGCVHRAAAALAALDAIEQLHKDEMIGKYDTALIDEESGKPHIAKRMDRPRVRVVPERFGGGTLPRKELHEAAGELRYSPFSAGQPR